MTIVPIKPAQHKAQGQYRMLNKGSDRGEIWLYGSIGSDWLGDGVSAKQFATDLKALWPPNSRRHGRYQICARF